MSSIADLTRKMISYSNGNLHDISHFLKVWGYAKTIGELENLDPETQFILEAAALTHDIACPLCREKYGTASGPLQEKEGMILLPEFLADTDLTQKVRERIIYLVGHHHTLSEINGSDYQILIEADYLVNAEESGYSPAHIQAFCRDFFRTKSGVSLLKSIFPPA